MGSELKCLTGSNGSLAKHEDSPRGVDGAPKDERPLLKSDSNAGAAASTESIEEMEKKYAAYVRHDAYGTMGLGPLETKEKVLLGIAMVTLVPIRLVAGMLILVLYYLICRICTLFSAPNRDEEQEDYAHMGGWRRKVVINCGRFLSRAMLFTLGFYWISESHQISSDQGDSRGPRDESDRPGAIVSNHVSHLDILYHMSSSFPSFVAKDIYKSADPVLTFSPVSFNIFLDSSLKRSVAKLPLVGLISKCLGCVYVQRESKSSDSKGVAGIVTQRIIEAHQNKLSPKMLLFPEGTTTNGDFLLPFKTGAFLAKVPVLPVIVRYPYTRFSPAWDTISGVRHIFLLLCQFVNYMEVVHLPTYNPSEEEKENPKLYANNVRKLMATEGNLTLSEIGLAEKRIYHAALNGNSLPRALHQKDD